MFKAKQLNKLVQAGIITAAQRDQILIFDQTNHTGFISRLLSLLAVFTIGIGIISIIASNWQNISDNLKLFVMFALLISSGLATSYWHNNTKDEYAERMLIAIFMLIGAAIGLIIQIFQLSGGKWYSVLFIWCATSLPLLFVARKSYFSCFWTPVFLMWCGICIMDTLRPHGFGAIFDPFGNYMLYPIALFASLTFIGKMIALYAPQFSFGEVWRKDSLWAAYFCLALYIIFAWQTTHLYRLFIATIILVVSGLIYKHYGAYHLIRRNIKYGGLIIAMLYLNLAASLGLWKTGSRNCLFLSKRSSSFCIAITNQW